MTNLRNEAEILRDLGDWAHATATEFLLVIPHESRLGEFDSATVVRRVDFGNHPLAVHTAILSPKSKDGDIAVSFEYGNYYHLDYKHTAMARAVERATGCAVLPFGSN